MKVQLRTADMVIHELQRKVHKLQQTHRVVGVSKYNRLSENYNNLIKDHYKLQEQYTNMKNMFDKLFDYKGKIEGNEWMN